MILSLTLQEKHSQRILEDELRKRERKGKNVGLTKDVVHFKSSYGDNVAISPNIPTTNKNAMPVSKPETNINVRVGKQRKIVGIN